MEPINSPNSSTQQSRSSRLTELRKAKYEQTPPHPDKKSYLQHIQPIYKNPLKNQMANESSSQVQLYTPKKDEATLQESQTLQQQIADVNTTRLQEELNQTKHKLTEVDQTANEYKEALNQQRINNKVIQLLNAKKTKETKQLRTQLEEIQKRIGGDAIEDVINKLKQIEERDDQVLVQKTEYDQLKDLLELRSKGESFNLENWSVENQDDKLIIAKDEYFELKSQTAQFEELQRNLDLCQKQNQQLKLVLSQMDEKVVADLDMKVKDLTEQNTKLNQLYEESNSLVKVLKAQIPVGSIVIDEQQLKILKDNQVHQDNIQISILSHNALKYEIEQLNQKCAKQNQDIINLLESHQNINDGQIHMSEEEYKLIKANQLKPGYIQVIEAEYKNKQSQNTQLEQDYDQLKQLMKQMVERTNNNTEAKQANEESQIQQLFQEECIYINLQKYKLLLSKQIPENSIAIQQEVYNQLKKENTDLQQKLNRLTVDSEIIQKELETQQEKLHLQEKANIELQQNQIPAGSTVIKHSELQNMLDEIEKVKSDNLLDKKITQQKQDEVTQLVYTNEEQKQYIKDQCQKIEELDQQLLKLQEYVQHVEILKGSQSELQQQYLHLQQELANKQTDNINLQNNVNELKEQLQEQIDNEKVQQQNLISQNESEQERNIQQISRLNEENIKYKNSIKLLQEQIQQKELYLNKLICELQQLKEEQQKQHDDYSQQNQLIEQKEEVLINLQKQIKDLNKNKFNQSSQLLQLQMERKTMNTQIQELQKLNTELTEQHNKTIQDKSELNHSLNIKEVEKDMEIKKLNSKISLYETQIQNLKTQISQLMQKYELNKDELNEIIDKQSNELDNVKQDNNKLQQDIIDQKKKITQMEQLEQRNQITSQQSQESCKLLEEKIHQLVTTVSESQYECQDLKQQLQQKEFDFSLTKQSLDNQIIMLKDQVTKLKQKQLALQKQQSSSQSLEETIQEYNSQISTLQTELQQKVGQIKQIKDLSIKQQDQIDSLKLTNQQTEQKLEQKSLALFEQSKIQTQLKFEHEQQDFEVQIKIQELQQEVQQLKDALLKKQKTQVELEEIKKLQVTYSDQLTEKQIIIDEQSQQLIELNQKLSETMNKLNEIELQYQTEIQTLANQIVKLTNEKQNQSNQLNELSEQLLFYKKQENDKDEQIDQINSQIQVLKEVETKQSNEIMKVKMTLDTKVKQIEFLTKEVEILEEARVQSGNVQIPYEEYDQANKQIDNLTEQIENKEQEIKKLEQKITTVNKKLVEFSQILDIKHVDLTVEEINLQEILDEAENRIIIQQEGINELTLQITKNNQNEKKEQEEILVENQELMQFVEQQKEMLQNMQKTIEEIQTNHKQEIQDMKEQITEYEMEQNCQNMQITSKASQLVELEKMIQQMICENQQLHEQLDEQKAQYEDQINNITKESETLQISMTNIQEEMETQAKQQSVELLKSTTQLSNQQQLEIQKLQKQIQVLKASISKLEQQLDSVTVEKELLEIKNKERAEEVDAALLVISEQKTQKKNLMEEIDRLNACLENSQVENSLLSSQVGQCKDDVHQYQEQISELRARQEQLTLKQLNLLQRLQTQSNYKIATQKLQNVKEQLETYQKHLSQTETSVNSLQTEKLAHIQSLRAQIIHLQEQTAQFNRSNQQAHTELYKLIQQNNVLINELEIERQNTKNAKLDQSKMKNQIQNIKQQNEQFQIQAEQAQKQLEDLRYQTSNYRAVIDHNIELRRKTEQLTYQLDQQHITNHGMRKELVEVEQMTLSQQLDSAMEKSFFETSNIKVDQLRIENKQLKVKLETIQKECDKVKAQYKKLQQTNQ
ncbi:Hypothetical_protein [Hexamita inflata]|uniref:Hypothetical_protein n=1 Tax=Hexamita inflata TaxID=28002 RepID=A0ABP1M3B6_9EUKA